MNKKITRALFVAGLGLVWAHNAAAQASIPYAESFDNPGNFSAFTVIDANNDGTQWKYDDFERYAVCERNRIADDWLLTPKFQLSKGKTYTLKFVAKSSFDGTEETFDVNLGTAADAASMNITLLGAQTVSENYNPKEFTCEFTVENDGEYYIGFHLNTSQQTFTGGMIVDDLSLRSVEVSTEVPAPVTDVKLTYDYDSGLAKVTWKAPTTTNEGNPLDPIGLTYSVYRLFNAQPLVTQFPGTTYREEVKIQALNPANVYFGQGIVRYYVVPTNAQGTGEKAYSNFKVIGTPDKLPYVESFAGGNVTHFFGESHSKVGRWLPMQASNNFVQDGDEGMYNFTTSSVGETALGFTGLIDIKDASNPVLTFWYRYIELTDDDFQVQISVDGGDFQTLRKIDVASEDNQKKWVYVSIPLKDYVNSKFIQIGFSETTTSENNLLYVDNIRIFNQVEKDLSIEMLSFPSNLKVDELRNAKVKINNRGMNDVAGTDYQIAFYAGYEAIAKIAGTDIKSNEELDVTIPVTASRFLSADSVKVYAQLVYDADENQTDNVTDSTTLFVKYPLYPKPLDLAVSTAGTTDKLTWNVPAAPRTESTPVTDSFEDYEDFTIENFGRWTMFDLNGTTVVGINDMDYPNSGKPQAFTILNPEAAGMSDTWNTHTGNKQLAAFGIIRSTKNGWLISPDLSGEAQTISLFARSYSNSYAESFEVLYSTTDMEIASFIPTQEGTIKTTKVWKEYQFELPENAKYFAIHATSVDAFALLMDDFTFIPDSTGRQNIVLRGYNVYRDGVKINEDVVTTTSYDVASDAGNHLYHVTAVYDAGESALSNLAVTNPTGIDSTVVEKQEVSADIYDLSGRKVVNPRRGIYISNGKKIIVK